MSNGGHLKGVPGYYVKYNGYLEEYEAGVQVGNSMYMVSAKMVDNTWYHVAMSFLAADGLKVYFNGELLSNSTCTTPTALNFTAQPPTGQLTIGDSSCAIIDEVALWQSAQTFNISKSNSYRKRGSLNIGIFTNTNIPTKVTSIYLLHLCYCFLFFFNITTIQLASQHQNYQKSVGHGEVPLAAFDSKIILRLNASFK